MTDTQDTPPSNQIPIASDGNSAASAPAESASAEPDDIAPPFVAMIATIQSAVASNALPQARTAGASACRSILTILEAKPGQPLTAPPTPTHARSPLASLFSQPGLLTQLAAMSREQLLDMLKQVTGATSQRTQSPSSGAPRFHLIPIPQVRRPGGGS